MRSWIDHILVSQPLRSGVALDTAGIIHRQPEGRDVPKKFAKMRGTDHHPPYVRIKL
jgi:hypothetical protein